MIHYSGASNHCHSAIILLRMEIFIFCRVGANSLILTARSHIVGDTMSFYS